MKPAPFTYHRPGSVAEALDLLGALGEQAKVLAGGQSLLPLLSMRLAAPAHLVDVNRLTELAVVRTTADGVRVGALARHTAVEYDDAAARTQPLLRQALRHVAHPAIRNRGTCVGSLTHADPAAELCAVLALLDGSVEVASGRARRTVPAGGFFRGPFETALAPDELALAAHFPTCPPRTGTAFVEVSRRGGDYAVCAVAAVVTVHADGAVARARAAYASMGPVPTVLDLTDAAPADPAGDWGRAAAVAADRLDAEADLHASAAYRRHLARVLTTRALAAAAETALAGREP